MYDLCICNCWVCASVEWVCVLHQAGWYKVHNGDGRNRVLKGQVELHGIYLELVLIGPVLETRVLVMRSSW